jgi:hypothetical protein
MVLRCGFGHELPYALVQSAISNKIGSGAPRFFDALFIEGGPFPEDCGSIEMYLNVGIIHPYRFSELDDGLLDRVTQQTDSHGTVLAGLAESSRLCGGRP